MNTILITFLSALLLYVILSSAYFLVCLFRLSRITNQARPFERHTGTLTFGVFGDSTALGVGASTPEKSLAGLLGTHRPDTVIQNHSARGLSIQKIADELERQKSFDLLLICCGGIDILFLHGDARIRRDLQRLCAIATTMSGRVIVVTPLNLGLSTAFPWFVQRFFLTRSKRIGQIFNEEAQKFPNINLVNNLKIDTKNLLPPWHTMSAVDKIHPNDEGYRWVFERIQSKI